ncbi:hypothetical protein [Nocardia sp. NPDC056564]|uniref:hypothetical protein n=1 Tax=Nocardia sp. NPDC056564 TaxID=3345865 RepID=UPI0036725887
MPAGTSLELRSGGARQNNWTDPVNMLIPPLRTDTYSAEYDVREYPGSPDYAEATSTAFTDFGWSADTEVSADRVVIKVYATAPDGYQLTATSSPYVTWLSCTAPAYMGFGRGDIGGTPQTITQ